MSGDGTLINDDDFMAKVFASLPELRDVPKDRKLYIGDWVMIDGEPHMWDGQKWANKDTIYRVQV